MNIISFLRKLILFDVFWGRRSKIFHGLKDGGARAAQINDPTIAIQHNNSTIFNVNDPSNECFGGHYHYPLIDNSKVCIPFEASDWINNKITIIFSGIPSSGQIGPHNQNSSCMIISKYEKLNILSNPSFKEVDFQIIIDDNSKNIIMYKSAKTLPFSGKVMIDAKQN